MKKKKFKLKKKNNCVYFFNIICPAMIDDSISQGKYVETVNNTYQDLKYFQNFL